MSARPALSITAARAPTIAPRRAPRRRAAAERATAGAPSRGDASLRLPEAPRSGARLASRAARSGVAMETEVAACIVAKGEARKGVLEQDIAYLGTTRAVLGAQTWARQPLSGFGCVMRGAAEAMRTRKAAPRAGAPRRGAQQALKLAAGGADPVDA